MAKHISVWGINISLRVIELQNKKGCHSAVYSRLSENFCAKNSFWRSAIVPAMSLHRKKYFSLGHKHFAPGNRVVEQEGLPFGR
jgi:hypothetical protein